MARISPKYALLAASLALFACKGSTSTPPADAGVEELDVGVFQRPERAFRDAVAAPADAEPVDVGEETDSGVHDLGPHRRPSTATLIPDAPARYVEPLAVTATARGEIYFSALGDDGASIYQIDAAGRVALVHAGAPLVLPTGLLASPDGTRLTVADAAAGEQGALFEVGVMNPAPVRVLYDNGDLADPSGLAYDPTTEILYITGTALNTGAGGVWTIGPGDNTPVQMALDASLQLGDPTGIAVAPTTQTLYLLDGLSPVSERGRVWKIASNGNATLLADGVRAGFPAGLALAGDESFLLVATATRTRAGGDVVHAIDPISRAQTALPLGVRLVEARGIFQIPSTLRWVVIDGLGGASGTGAVYRLD